MTQPLTARAVTYKRYGGYEVVEVAERSVRPPAEAEVRIHVRAAAVSPTDVALRDPQYARGTLPATPGMDAAGVIEAVGPGVTRLRVGDEVMAAVMPRRPEGGAQAAYIVVPAASVVAVPAGTSLEEASTLPMNGLTALLAVELSGLQKGETLAVSGGAGLLAHYAIAVAKHRGLRVVADARKEEMDLVRGYGADVVVERSEDFAAAVRRAVPEGAGALLDTALLKEASFPALRDGGVYLPVRGWEGATGERGIQVRQVWVSEALERTEWLELLRKLAESGAIKLKVAGKFLPEQAADAQRALNAGGLRGRPVIIF